MYIILWGCESVWPDVWPKNKCRSLWPILYDPMILPCILKTIWCMDIIIWDYESVWPLTFDLKRIVGHYDLYVMVKWFWVTSWRLFDVWTSYFRTVGQYDQTFDLKVNVSHCDLYFMVQWFCLISRRLFDAFTSYFGIMNQYDLRFDLKMNIGHCDLFFMVQWFCLVSSRLLMYEHHYLALWISMTLCLTSK